MCCGKIMWVGTTIQDSTSCLYTVRSTTSYHFNCNEETVEQEGATILRYLLERISNNIIGNHVFRFYLLILRYTVIGKS